jgi:hypothetical protein
MQFKDYFAPTIFLFQNFKIFISPILKICNKIIEVKVGKKLGKIVGSPTPITNRYEYSPRIPTICIIVSKNNRGGSATHGHLLKSEIGERKRGGGVLYLHVFCDVIRRTLLQREIASTGFLTNTE